MTTFQIFSWTCEREPGWMFELPWDYLEFRPAATNICALDNGILHEIRDTSGLLIGQCTVEEGLCSVEIPATSQVGSVEPLNLPAGVQLSAEHNSPVNGNHNAAFFWIKTDSDTPQTELLGRGQLAYAIKVGEHWDIWLHDFATGENHQLTNESNSDQWAPAWSHDGSKLAYLSDQIDGSNQVWIMEPDGSNKRQITDWQGTEQILYVAWSSDDQRFIVTLRGDDHRLVTVPVTGGSPEDYVPPSSSFAVTGGDGFLFYVAQNGAEPSIIAAGEEQPTMITAFITTGDAPSVTPDGLHLALQVGELGNRHIVLHHVEQRSMPTLPRIGDDSNPVWLTADHTHVAFVSALGTEEVINVCRLWEDFATPLAIAPHDRVWYLSMRFLSTGN
jgi:hypothetical protein